MLSPVEKNPGSPSNTTKVEKHPDEQAQHTSVLGALRLVSPPPSQIQHLLSINSMLWMLPEN